MTNLNPQLRKADLSREVFSIVNIRVVVILKGLLQFVQLEGGECRPVPAKFSQQLSTAPIRMSRRAWPPLLALLIATPPCLNNWKHSLTYLRCRSSCCYRHRFHSESRLWRIYWQSLTFEGILGKVAARGAH